MKDNFQSLEDKMTNIALQSDIKVSVTKIVVLFFLSITAAEKF